LKKCNHGVATKIIIIENDTLFQDIPNEIIVGRYHSWVVNKINLPKELIITSEDSNEQIMSLRHVTYDVKAVQFHPESIMTPHGKQILKNWIDN